MTTPDIAALTTERDARQTAKIERLQREVAALSEENALFRRDQLKLAALLAENAELKRCNANQRAALKQPRDREIEEEILGRAWAALTERAEAAERERDALRIVLTARDKNESRLLNEIECAEEKIKSLQAELASAWRMIAELKDDS